MPSAKKCSMLQHHRFAGEVIVQWRGRRQSGNVAGPQGHDHVCPAEHAGWLTTPVRKLFNNPGRILKGLVDEGDVAIDLGCGPGFLTLPLAEMVGQTGSVIAVDVQEEMLDRLRARAGKAGLVSRIRFHRSVPEGPGILGPADFALAFWMLHEVADQPAFLLQVHDSLREGGEFLLVEPRGHVSKAQFVDTVGLVQGAGFTPAARPRVGFSRAALFRRS
jgi:SAM-dependent methyltransferase